MILRCVLKGFLLVLILCLCPSVHAGGGSASHESGEDLQKKAASQAARVASALARCEMETGILEVFVARKKGDEWLLSNRLKGFVARQDILDPWGNPWRVEVFGDAPRVCSRGPDIRTRKDDICRSIRDTQLGPRAASVATRVRLAKFSKLRHAWEAVHGAEPWTVYDLLGLDD